jgi:hypothetical protein
VTLRLIRPADLYPARQARTPTAAEQYQSATPVHAGDSPHPEIGTRHPSAMPEPASLLTHRDRQRARFDAATRRAWQTRAHRADLRRIIRNVDSGDLSIAAAMHLVTTLARKQEQQAA